MRFRFFEYAFFVSAFGAVAFFPAARPFLPLLRVPAVVSLIALTGACLITALAIAHKNTARPSRTLAIFSAITAGCGAIFASIASQSLAPAFVAWGTMACIAALTFGSVLARRFFRRVEKDFRRNMGHVMALSLAGNAILLVLMAFFSSVSPAVAGTITAAITLAALL